ncbi:MAG: hypothetical protein LUD03_01170 [Firmicutes bacterium]|nr:hypothetical protein [Bacillota bacterium]
MARKLGRRLGEDTHIIKRGEFSLETAKMYIAATIVVFHIIPLIFVFMGDTGIQILINIFLFTINIIAIFAIGLFYGVRIGFNFKFPLVMTVISILSYFFYYSSTSTTIDIGTYAVNYIATGMIVLIVYAVFSYVSTIIGGWLKRFFV